MARYQTDYLSLQDTDRDTLIEAAERYLNATSFPCLDVFAAILCIKKVEDEE